MFTACIRVYQTETLLKIPDFSLTMLTKMQFSSTQVTISPWPPMHASQYACQCWHVVHYLHTCICYFPLQRQFTENCWGSKELYLLLPSYQNFMIIPRHWPTIPNFLNQSMAFSLTVTKNTKQFQWLFPNLCELRCQRETLWSNLI